MENSFLETHLRAAMGQLSLAQSQLDTAIDADLEGDSSTDALNGASGSLMAARLTMGEIRRELEVTTESSSSLRSCPACGKSIRLQATRCGYCWKAL